MTSIILIVVVLLIYVSILRSIFRVNEQVKNQKIMIDLLGQMLLSQGYSVDEVRKIIEKYK